MTRLLPLLALLLTAAAQAEPVAPNPDVVGPDPRLPPPQISRIPIVKIAPAKGWPEGGKPETTEGLFAQAFADKLVHPRWLYVLPNGDVLVAETNAPPRPDDDKGIKGWVTGLFMKRAGAAVASANRITLLRDTNGDGVADLRSPFLTDLNSPFGMALVGSTFYVANTDAVMRFPYVRGETQILAAGERFAELPGGTLNHHWTKSLIADKRGRKLYVGVGSNSNIAENGLHQEERRAAILEIDIRTGATRVYASGLRNPVGLAWEPETNVLWTVVNERDEIGNDLVPDYLTSVRDGAFYGWPWSYFGQNVDPRVKPERPEMVAKAITPDYALGAHVAALGLAWSGRNALPPSFHNGMFIGEHGSWNRKPLTGYEVVFVPFSKGRPVGMPLTVLRGFVDAKGNALGRPVGVAMDSKGALLVADDVGNVIWRVTGTAPK